MRTAEIVAYFGKLKGMDTATANLKATELLTQYGLGDWVNKKCEAMSKGMGQKVQILGTIIHNPDLVILDEPFSGLDPVNRDLMRDTILQMKRQGRTVIFSTHVMEQAEQLCDAMMMIHKSELAFEGTVAEIKRGLKVVIEEVVAALGMSAHYTVNDSDGSYCGPDGVCEAFTTHIEILRHIKDTFQMDVTNELEHRPNSLFGSVLKLTDDHFE